MSKLQGFTAIVILAGACSAQAPSEHVSIQAETQRTLALASVRYIDDTIASLDTGKLLPKIPGSWEARILDAAEKAGGQNLQLALGTRVLAGVYTLKTKDGDTLVAKWSGQPTKEAPELNIWLWDTPADIVFFIQVPTAILAPDAFPRYVDGLIRWDQNPIHLTSLVLRYPENTPGRERAIGMGKYIQTERGIYRLWFAAAALEGTGYVGIGMSKSMLLSGYPPEANGVRERFPPLRSRLANVARYALFEELGKGYEAHQLLTYPLNRDAIVINELLSRGPLSEVELDRIIVGPFESGDLENGELINNRMIALLTALGERHELAHYAESVGRVLLRERIHPAMQESVAGHLFRAVQTENIDYSDMAISFLEQGRLADLSFLYLEQNSKDGSVLDKLARAKLAPNLETKRKAAMDKIANRLRQK